MIANNLIEGCLEWLGVVSICIVFVFKEEIGDMNICYDSLGVR